MDMKNMNKAQMDSIPVITGENPMDHPQLRNMKLNMALQLASAWLSSGIYDPNRDPKPEEGHFPKGLARHFLTMADEMLRRAIFDKSEEIR
jgi:hypothetical protein